MPKISVIIPLYNKENTIKNTIESVLNQTFTDYEIIVVNDGSTDKSLDIVKGFNDSRIRIIDKDNEGVSKTRNRGIKEAKGVYLCFLDADDILENKAFESFMKLYSQYGNIDILSGNYFEVEHGIESPICKIEKEGLLHNPDKNLWLKNWNMRLGSFLVSKHCCCDSVLFPENMCMGEDVYFVLKLMESYRICYTNNYTMKYMRQNSTLSKQKPPLEQCLSYCLSCSGQDFFHKMVCAEIIAKGIVKNIVYSRSLKRINKMIFKHMNELQLIILSQFLRLMYVLIRPFLLSK